MAVEAYLELMDRLEGPAAANLKSVLEVGLLGMAEQFRQTRLPGLPPDGHRQALENALLSIWTLSCAGSAEIFVADPALKAADTVSGLVETFVREFGAGTARQILLTSQTQIRDLMAGGLSSGQSADIVYSELLEKIPQIAGVRALLISRTEIHAATQFAAWQLARQSSVPLVKIWNSVKDERTRDFGELGRISQFNHRAMDGQRVSLNDAFLVPRIIGGYETLMFPGDPRGSAGNVINCRCIQTYERADR